MSEYIAQLNWSLEQGQLTPGNYSTDHHVRFSGGVAVPMASAPDYGGNPQSVNPEQALAAALSSCHMMTFLALAAKARWQVTHYRDRAIAVLGKTGQGRTRVSAITLHPEVDFAPGHTVSHDQLETMHERAHRYCFVANTLSCDMRVVVSPVVESV